MFLPFPRPPPWPPFHPSPSPRILASHRRNEKNTSYQNSQLYLSFGPNNIANQEATLARVERCFEDIREWMLNDNLKLNDDKTEFIIIGISQKLAKVSSIPFVSGLQLSLLCHLQGIWAHGLILSLQWQSRILKTCNSAFYYLYNLRRIRKYLSRDNTKTLVNALFQVESVIATAFYMVCQSIKTTSYNVCRASVVDWYVMKVNIVTLLLY